MGRIESAGMPPRIFSLSFQVVEHAKAAVADMWLVLFVTLAHWAAFELMRDKFRARWPK